MLDVETGLFTLPETEGRKAISRHINRSSALYPPELYLHRTSLKDGFICPAYFECYDFAFDTILNDESVNHDRFDFAKEPYTYLSTHGYQSPDDIRRGDLILYGTNNKWPKSLIPRDNLVIIHAGIYYQTTPERLIVSKIGKRGIFVHSEIAVSDKYGDFFIVMRKIMDEEQYAGVIHRLDSIEVLGASRDYWAEIKDFR
jgi:hypothetical protein